MALLPHELAVIASYYREKKIPKGTFILREGQVCQFEGYVIKGCCKVSVIDTKGGDNVLHFAAPDWWLMDIDSFANRSASRLNIQALTDCTILWISYDDKERLYREVPKMERLFRCIYQKSVVAWQRRLMRNHTMNAEQRYDHFVATYPEINQLVTNKQVASYLGITQEFLSMIRKRRATKKG